MFAGVARTLVYDNLRSAVLERAGHRDSVSSALARARRALSFCPAAVYARRAAMRRARSSAKFNTSAMRSLPRGRLPMSTI